MTTIQQKVKSSRNAWVDYLIVTILLFMSGNPALMGEVRMEVFTVLTSFLFLIILAARRDILLLSRLLVVTSILSGILAIQCITFDFWPFHTMLGFLLRLFIGYAAFRLVKEFPQKYVKVIFYTCVISLFFHSFAILYEITEIDLIKYFAPLDKIANPYRGFHIVVHNFLFYANVPEYYQTNQCAFRNSSYFWEPAVFTAYISLAIVFLGLAKDRFDKKRYKHILVVLVITLLTTMSTAGYALLPLCLFFHVRDLSLTRRQLPKLLGFALVVAIFCVIAYQLDFVGEKIQKEFDSIAYREPGWEKARFGSLVYDLEYIKQRPIFGWGLHSKTRHMLSSGESIHGMGNGLSDFTAKFGLVGLVTVLTCIWLGVYRLTKCNWKISALFVIFVVLVLNGERLLDFPVYLGLMFLEPVSENRHSILRFENSTITAYKRNFSTRLQY